MPSSVKTDVRRGIWSAWFGSKCGFVPSHMKGSWDILEFAPLEYEIQKYSTIWCLSKLKGLCDQNSFYVMAYRITGIVATSFSTKYIAILTAVLDRNLFKQATLLFPFSEISPVFTVTRNKLFDTVHFALRTFVRFSFLKGRKIFTLAFALTCSICIKGKLWEKLIHTHLEILA